MGSADFSTVQKLEGVPMATSEYDDQRELANLSFYNRSSDTTLHIAGSINCFTSLLFFISYTIYLKILLGVQKMEKSLYILSIINSIFDMVQLVCHFYSGVILILAVECGPKRIDQVFGSFLSSSWIQTTVNITHFTLLRMFIVLSPIAVRKVYKRPHAVIVPGVGIFLVALVIENSPWAAFLFEPASFTWFFDDERVLSSVLDYSDLVLTIMYLSASVLSYAVIVTKILINIGGRRETKITIQAIIYCSYTSCTFIFWVFIDPIVVYTPAPLFLSNYLWLIWNGLNPTLEIVFNRRIRMKYAQVLCCRKKKTRADDIHIDGVKRAFTITSANFSAY
ncbi:hypothetical protein Y032_0336g2884 [Ancylostoma ceylanicum]|uniref:7TM GPCR serpentine receptor class x (Srx) domain-containing protein n=1 Tax=Ancylostoma ceylanicum TaxID=53326 RepID=A0A016RZI5_9BILA|nr:hypothetical protein Y032_0336g2884 [Ancylostoma ceylanicum]